MIKVKLIIPPIAGRSHSLCEKIDMPLGIGVLSSFLRKNGFMVDVDDLNAQCNSLYSENKSRKTSKDFLSFYKQQVDKGYYTGIRERLGDSLSDRFFELINMDGFEAAGISVMSNRHILGALLLAEKIKKRYKIPVIVGGPYVTLFAGRFFPKYDFIDYAVVGEGEIPFFRLLSYLNGKENIGRIPSLVYRYKNQVRFNQRNFFNIESQSVPDYDGLPLDLYRINSREEEIPLSYLTSRGCTSRCNYCNYFRVDGPYQAKSLPKILKDIVSLKKKYNTKNFCFHDANFNVSYKRLDDLCEAFLRENIDIKWKADNMKGDNFDKNLVVKMKEAGCHIIGWGIESGSDKILRSMNKGISTGRIAECLKVSNEAGIKNLSSFILNYPYETVKDLEQTAVFIRNNAKFLANMLFNWLGVMPGTLLFHNPEKEKINLKGRKDTFFTYNYDYKEKERNLGGRQKISIKRMRLKIIAYRFFLMNFKIPYFFQDFILELVDFLIRKMPDFLIQTIAAGGRKFKYSTFF